MIGLYPKWIALIVCTCSKPCHHHFLLLLFGFQFFLLWWQLFLTLNNKEYSYSWLFLICALNPPLLKTGLVTGVFSKEQWHLKRTPLRTAWGFWPSRSSHQGKKFLLMIAAIKKASLAFTAWIIRVLPFWQLTKLVLPVLNSSYPLISTEIRFLSCQPLDLYPHKCLFIQVKWVFNCFSGL